MCTTNIYVHVRPDGRRSTTSQLVLCPSSRFNRPCAAHVEVHQPMPHDVLPTTTTAPVTTHFPPTPQYSPRPSSRDSASDADRHSRHSSTSSSRRRQRSPGIYVNGQRVVDVHGSARRERVMLVPHPPTPRTPPQAYNMPRTAPPSPSANLSLPYGSSPRESYSRPYLVDERRMQAAPIHHPASPASSSRHSRQASTSSHGSRHSSSAAAAAADDEERRRRREAEREQRRIDRKAQELRERIEKANAEIASRPTVRVVNEQQQQQQQQQQQPKEPKEQQRRSRRDGFDEVVGAMGRMTVEDRNWKERRAHERALELEKEEQKAQDQRLRERMVPRRRATVGPGSRRHRVAYDDGLYRWE